MVGVNDVRDFVLERVQCFGQAMFGVRLPAQYDPVARRLVVAAEGFTRRQLDRRHLKATLEVEDIQTLKLRTQQGMERLLLRCWWGQGR